MREEIYHVNRNSQKTGATLFILAKLNTQKKPTKMLPEIKLNKMVKGPIRQVHSAIINI